MPLLVLATGSGKTVVAAELIARRVHAGERVWFLAPRRELVTQASRQLTRAGIRHGVVQAGHEHLRDPFAMVQVLSIDTVLARMVRRQRLTLPDPALIVIDEAHLAITRRRTDLLARWPQAQLVGLTATHSACCSIG